MSAFYHQGMLLTCFSTWAAQALMIDLSLMVDRRNKIAHEADIDPSYPGQRWPIDRLQVECTADLLEEIGGAVFKVIA